MRPCSDLGNCKYSWAEWHAAKSKCVLQTVLTSYRSTACRCSCFGCPDSISTASSKTCSYACPCSRLCNCLAL